MKNLLLLLSIVILPVMLSAQEQMGKINVSDWALFSSGHNKQLNKINDSTMYSYYRGTGNKSGILIYNKSMKVIRDIPFELDKNKKVMYTRKAFAEFTSFPYTFYSHDLNAVVVVGYTKNDKKDYSITAVTYSIDGTGFLDFKEIAKASSENFNIMYSHHDNYFMVAELFRKEKGGPKVKYNVFNQKCEKIYSAEGSFLKDGDNYCHLLDNGELIHYNIKESGRKLTYMFTKFDSLGSSATAAFAPPLTDPFNYDNFEVVKSNNGGYYASCMKYRQKAVGIAILNVDFDNKTIKKITDKDFNKEAIAKLNTIKTKSAAMVENKPKPIKDFDTYSIFSTSGDNENIYLVIQDFYFKSRTVKVGNTYNTTNTYGSEGLLIACYDLDGNEKWITPVKRQAKQAEGDLNTFNGNGCSINLSNYETPDKICLLVRSLDKTYYISIDKQTGKESEPVLVLGDEDALTNSNCMGWFSENEVVVLSLKGLSLFKKNDFWLNGIKIKNTAI